MSLLCINTPAEVCLRFLSLILGVKHITDTGTAKVLAIQVSEPRVNKLSQSFTGVPIKKGGAALLENVML